MTYFLIKNLEDGEYLPELFKTERLVEEYIKLIWIDKPVHFKIVEVEIVEKE